MTRRSRFNFRQGGQEIFFFFLRSRLSVLTYIRCPRVTTILETLRFKRYSNVDVCCSENRCSSLSVKHRCTGRRSRVSFQCLFISIHSRSPGQRYRNNNVNIPKGKSYKFTPEKRGRHVLFTRWSTGTQYSFVL